MYESVDVCVMFFIVYVHYIGVLKTWLVVSSLVSLFVSFFLSFFLSFFVR